MAIVTVLSGHDSPETAYVVDDYPYGFRLRCKIRYWVETNPKHGQRVVSQTTNPKKDGEVWNKSKPSTYSRLRVLYLDEQDHVQNDALSIYEFEPDKVAAFEEQYRAALQTPYAQETLRLIRLTKARYEQRKAEQAAMQKQDVPA